jgi:PAS domain S-box-containing protein
MANLRFLLLEDSLLDAELIRSQISDGNIECDLVHVTNQTEFISALQQNCKFDLILSDYLLPNFDGIAALKIAHHQCPEVPFIFVSASLGEELAIEALKMGATDYVLKQRLVRLVPAINRALQEAEDRNQRQKAEAALQRSESRFRRLVQANLIGCIFWHVDGRILDANDAFLQMVGYSREDLSAGLLNWRSMTPQEQLPLSEISIAQIKQHGFAETLEKEYIRKDGTLISILLGGVMFENSVDQGVSFVVDLSERKQAEKALQAQNQRLQLLTEQLTQANHIKDEFLAVLSHELRTPLNPILGWSRILQTRRHDGDTVARALETIERNAKIQTQLIDDLLDVSRILRGKLTLNSVPVNLISAISAALETVRLAADAKGITIKFGIVSEGCHEAADAIAQLPLPASNWVGGRNSSASTAPILVSGDPGRLQQILWNLLSNAIKFTPSGGTIEIRLEVQGGQSAALPKSLPMSSTANASSASYPTTPTAVITITDTGKGISPDFLPHLFDYFRQEDGATTRRFGGLGLGLAIVRHLVEHHGGTVDAASAGEDQGATFTVCLPLLKQDKPSPPPEQALSPTQFPLHGVRILIVDDDFDSQDFATFVLEQAGAKVVAVNSGQAALQYLAESPADLLISDIGMPEMDGYMLMEQIQCLPRSRPLPAIALTAYASELDRQQAQRVGFQEHLSKPVNPTVLINTIAIVLATVSSI